MALSNVADWKNTSACGTACGAADEPKETPSACGSACGAGDK
ncbi:MAG TPA: ACGX-repeat peptide [Candidatus Monoglobus merdigallinarum]|uniref:ACGX-repeat peptide n=1 Tax=Candidatus Monoglobus merdigallinarum TaxID=2838698 RepID=A0A9D1PQJ3_9FIRM|nr:ACGX-repeat peptide [Candidatus Monoglobus merdigallinarum]